MQPPGHSLPTSEVEYFFLQPFAFQFLPLLAFITPSGHHQYAHWRPQLDCDLLQVKGMSDSLW